MVVARLRGLCACERVGVRMYGCADVLAGGYGICKDKENKVSNTWELVKLYLPCGWGSTRVDAAVVVRMVVSPTDGGDADGGDADGGDADGGDADGDDVDGDDADGEHESV